MSHIFISYSRKDLEIADKIVSGLVKHELDTWIDWKNIPKSLEFDKEIFRGIEEADALLFLISPDSIQSEICKQEISHAYNNNKRIITVLVRNIDTKTFPSIISKINWIDCRNSESFTNAIGDIAKAIHTDYDWLKFHTQLQLKSLAWERDKEDSLLLRGKELDKSERIFSENQHQLDPQPTTIQSQFLLESRVAERKLIVQGRKTRNRILLLATATVLSVITAIWLGNQFGNASEGQQEAITQASQIAATNAANEQVAGEQTNIALARRLAASAQSVYTPEIDKQILSGLLAVESMKLYPNAEALRTLQSITLAHPWKKFGHGQNISAIAMDSYVNTDYVAAGDNDGIIYIWEATDGNGVFSLTASDAITALDIDGRQIVFGDNNGNIAVWDFLSNVRISNIQQASYIQSVEFLRGGQLIFSASRGDGHSVRVSDVATGNIVSHFDYDGDLAAYAISSDGALLALSYNKCEIESDFDCTKAYIYICDARSGEEITRLESTGIATSLAFAKAFEDQSQNTLVAGSSNGTDGIVTVWNSADWSEQTQMVQPDVYGSVDVAISPDGLKIASSSDYDDSTVIWNTVGDELLRKSSISGSLTFSGDSRLLLVNGVNVVTFDVNSGKEIARIESNYAEIASNLEEYYRSRNVIANRCNKDDNCSIQLWDFHNGGTEVARKVNLYEPNSIAISPDGATAVTGGFFTGANVWDVKTGGYVAQTDNQDFVTTVAYSPNGKYIVTGGDDGTARVWEISRDEINTGNAVASMQHDDKVTSVVFSPDSNYVISGSDDNTIRVWEILTGNVIVHKENFYSSNNYNDKTPSLEVSTDGKLVASVNNDGTASTWELLTGKEVMHTSQTYISSLAFSSDGKYIVAGDIQNTVQVWEISTGNKVSEMLTDEGVLSVAFSPDNQHVAAGSADRIVRVWDIETGGEISRMYHDDKVTIVSFNLDGNYLMSASDDHTVRIWETFSGNEATRMVHGAPVTLAIFSPDGEFMFSAGVANGQGASDGVRIWLWGAGNIVDDVCSRLPRSLTEDEWREYIGGALPYEAVCENIPLEPEPTKDP